MISSQNSFQNCIEFAAKTENEMVLEFFLKKEMILRLRQKMNWIEFSAKTEIESVLECFFWE